MSRLATLGLLALLGIAIIASACGGDDNGAGEQVQIQHLDLEGVDLTPADVFDPPVANPYPDVVVEVNGEPITGAALVRLQVKREIDRRETEALAATLSEVAAELLLREIKVGDPLEALIDDLLLSQAVVRLDLLPSYSAAVAYTNEQERRTRDLSRPQRELALEELRMEGLPTENWASSETIVERYRAAIGLAGLWNQECAGTASQTPNNFAGAAPCDPFLQQERANADIKYFVVWAD